MKKVIQMRGDIALGCWMYDLPYRITMKFKVYDVMREVVTQIASFADNFSITGMRTYMDNPCLTRISSINRFSV